MSPEAVNQETYKMSYIPAQYRVRIEISPKFCKSLEKAPPQIIEKAKAKLESEKQAGRIAFYHIYERRLAEVWNALRAQPEHDQTPVAITLACGAPEIPGIQVEADPDGLATVSVKAPIEQIRNWRFQLFKFVIHKKMRELKINGMPDPASIHAIWLKACDYGKVEKASLPPLRKSADPESAYEFFASTDKKELHLVIRSFKQQANPEFIRGLLQRAHQEVVKLSNSSGKHYHYLKADLIRSLRSALRGPERLDIDMPFILLISRMKEEQALPPPHREGIRDFYEIVASEDAMSAEITDFNDDIYEQADLNFNFTSLMDDLKNQNIFANLTSEQIDEIRNKIETKTNLKGTRIASGQIPIAAEDPYIQFDFQTRSIEDNKKILNMRDMQQRKIAQAGELIASIRFKKQGQPGKDVFGRNIPYPIPDISGLQIGEGLRVDDKLKIYATINGMPLLESDKSISVSKAYVHAGNVNLGTGNIRFDGPIHIQGNVERGSLIVSSSMVTVDGLVEAATIRCLGDLKVAGGIIGDKNSKISVGGDLFAQFLDNADVSCLGDVTVERGIVSSQVKCLKNIKLTGEGSNLVGGTVIVWEELTVGNLGKSAGASTKIYLGADWKEHAKLEKYQGRLNKFKQWLQTLNLEMEKYKNHKRLTPEERQKAPQIVETLKKKISACERLSEKSKRDLLGGKRHRAVNMRAKINVKNTLSSNCDIEIQGKPITLAADLTAVQIVMNASTSGNHIRQLIGGAEEKAS